MNDEVYIKHQYDALTKNATPLGLLGLATQLKDFANSKLATVSVHITHERPGDWYHTDLTVRLEEGTKLSEALPVLEADAVLAAPSNGLTNPMFFWDVSHEERRNATPEDIVQGSTFYAIYVTLTN